MKEPVIDKQLTEALINRLKENNPLLHIIKESYKRVKTSMLNIDNTLKLMGLYLKNIYFFHGDTNLNYLLPENVCYDLFNKDTCNTKIDKLLYKPRQTMKGGNKITKHKKTKHKKTKHKKTKKIFKGGTNQERCPFCDKIKYEGQEEKHHYCGIDKGTPRKTEIELKEKPKISFEIDYLSEIMEQQIDKNSALGEIDFSSQLGKIFEKVYMDVNIEYFIHFLKSFKKNISENNSSNSQHETQKNTQQAPNTGQHETPKIKRGTLENNQYINLSYPFSYDAVDKGILDFETMHECHKLQLNELTGNEDLFKKCGIHCDCQDCSVMSQYKINNPYSSNYNPDIITMLILLQEIMDKYYVIDINREKSILFNLKTLSKEERNELYVKLKENKQSLDETYDINTFKQKEPINQEEKERINKIIYYLEKINFTENYIDYIFNYYE
jgi:hypothetical protein